MNRLLNEVYLKYRNENRIYGAMLELTNRCICRCIHCYIGKKAEDELSTGKVLDILRQLKDEGTFNLSMTGGEVFLRKDLRRILEESGRLGFFTNLLTTGILIDESAADMLAGCGINAVEVSILGATAETHDGIMRRPGAFNSMLKAAELLTSRGICVVMKNTILKPNADELNAAAAVAEKYGALFNASLSVLPRMDGESGPQDYAVDFETAARLAPHLVSGGILPGEEAGSGAVLTCNAGRTTCGISAAGDVYPCIIWQRSIGNLKENSLQDVWHDDPDPYLAEIRNTTEDDVQDCLECSHKASCRRCPGMAFSETGNHKASVPSACRLAGRKELPEQPSGSPQHRIKSSKARKADWQRR